MSRKIYVAVEDGGEGQECGDEKKDVVEKAEGMEEQDKKKNKPEQPEAHSGGSDDHLKTEKQEEEEKQRGVKRKGDDIEEIQQERLVSVQEKEGDVQCICIVQVVCVA